MEKVVVEFSRDEVNALVQMMNVAVKADGLQAARAALHMIDKIDAAVAAQNMPAPAADSEKAETYTGA